MPLDIITYARFLIYLTVTLTVLPQINPEVRKLLIGSGFGGSISNSSSTVHGDFITMVTMYARRLHDTAKSGYTFIKSLPIGKVRIALKEKPNVMTKEHTMKHKATCKREHKINQLCK